MYRRSSAIVRLAVLAACALLLFGAIGCTVNITAPSKETPASTPAPAPSGGGSSSSTSNLKAGDSVAALWTDGATYLATVVSVTGDTVKVQYTDDSSMRDVKTSEVELITPETWNNGDRVRAVWSSGRFYDGTVTGDKGSGIYTVKWDDGSAPSDVPNTKIIGQ